MIKLEKAGLTLVEVMVAAVLASMVMGSAMGIWSYASRNIARTTARQIMQMDSRRILSQLKADLKAAKADTFKQSENPMTLEFARYAVSDHDNEKLSMDRTEDIQYILNQPLLMRTVRGRGTRNLSGNVENLRITRKTLSAEELENAPYLEARVDIAVELKSVVAGSNIEEFYSEHTSVVVRDEFYAKANKDREEVLVIAKDVAAAIEKDADSSFFNDVLNADSLRNLTNAQLDDLDDTQRGSIREANNGLDELNKRIGKVDTGKKWWQGTFFGIASNEEGAEVKRLRNDLEKIKISDNPSRLEPASSNNRPSDQAENIIKALAEKTDTLEEDFIKESFQGHKVYDLDNEEEEKRAALQKRAYEMKLTDRSIDKALEKMKPEELEEARNNGDIPDKMIEQMKRTEAEIREELAATMVVPVGSPEFEAMVQREIEDQRFLEEQYANCSLDWMDGSGQDQNKIKAYEAAKQLKTLAESKKETLKLKELAMDNRAEIARARELKRESFNNN